MLTAVLDDGTSADDADKSILIIDYGNKILRTGTLNQIVHTGGNPNGDVVFPAGDFHNSSGFCLTHIHIAQIFQRPQKISLCQRATVLPTLV